MDDQIKPKRKRLAREVEYYLSVQPNAPSYALIPKSKTPAGRKLEVDFYYNFYSRKNGRQERQNVSEAIAQYIRRKAQQNPEEVRRQLMGDWKV